MYVRISFVGEQRQVHHFRLYIRYLKNYTSTPINISQRACVLLGGSFFAVLVFLAISFFSSAIWPVNALFAAAAASGSQTYVVPGSFSFTVPTYTSITVTVNGAGGGGGGG
ncbi:hypothetical protein HY478_01040, partial [Candidatus Uhrbacteria bacterium]|nr:hypothetical protein [Candidatus Uhrbacteria bacterium]